MINQQHQQQQQQQENQQPTNKKTKILLRIVLLKPANTRLRRFVKFINIKTK